MKIHAGDIRRATIRDDLRSDTQIYRLLYTNKSYQGNKLFLKVHTKSSNNNNRTLHSASEKFYLASHSGNSHKMYRFSIRCFDVFDIAFQTGIVSNIQSN